MATIDELLTQKAQLIDQVAELDKKIAQVRDEQRSVIISEIRALMSKAGLTMADIIGTAPNAAPRTKRAASAEKSPSKVAAKYRDPESGNTWSGRGLKPRWLAGALAAGKTIEDFTI